MLLGDFNAVRSESDRKNCVFQTVDTDLFNNSAYTWYGADNKSSKLDRVFVSSAWYMKGDSVLQAGRRRTSDHKPLILKNSGRD